MRSLILAGGGLKVGFQAGVLQVWLDEAGLTFDHADGASGGCLNLAMYCQGFTGTQIADAWRNYDPFLPMDLNLDGPNQFTHQQSFFTYDRFRANVLTRWGIDWNQIRAGQPARHVQSLQLLEEAARSRDQRRHGRRPAGQRGLAADVVPSGDHQRRQVHRRRLHHRRERRRGDPPRRRRDLGDLDGEHARRVAARFRLAVLPHHRDRRRHQLLRDLESPREEQPGDRRRPAGRVRTHDHAAADPGRSAGALSLQLRSRPDDRGRQPGRRDGARLVPRARIPLQAPAGDRHAGAGENQPAVHRDDARLHRSRAPIFSPASTPASSRTPSSTSG